MLQPQQVAPMTRSLFKVRALETSRPPDKRLRTRRSQRPGSRSKNYRIVAETVSGGVAAMERPAFAWLVDRLEPGDMLVVTKMDRLERNARDVMATTERLGKMSDRVNSLDLRDADLNSAAGRITRGILNVVAQFERDSLHEWTQAGIDRARAEGKHLGRPPVLDVERRSEIEGALKKGETISALARRFGTSRQTVQRIDRRHAWRMSSAVCPGPPLRRCRTCCCGTGKPRSIAKPPDRGLRRLSTTHKSPPLVFSMLIGGNRLWFLVRHQQCPAPAIEQVLTWDPGGKRRRPLAVSRTLG